jgi:hypothetical protein
LGEHIIPQRGIPSGEYIDILPTPDWGEWILPPIGGFHGDYISPTQNSWLGGVYTLPYGELLLGSFDST